MGNFFQSPEFYNVLTLAYQNPFVVTAPERDRVAGLLAYVLPEHSSLVSKFFPSLMVYYGPILAEDADLNAVDALLRALDSEARKQGALGVTMRTPFPPRTLNDVFGQNGYSRFDPGGEYSVIIDLAKDENALWKEMKRLTRRCIKKAIKRDVKIKEVTNEQELHNFYQIYLHTAERRSFIPYPFSFFNALRSIQPRRVTKFFLAWHGERPIAGILNTVHKGKSVPFVAASLKDSWGLRPNHLLFWHSICWSKFEAKAQTFKLYHLPKAKCPKNGIDYYSFKTCFGGDLIRECSFYYKVISPLKLQLLEKGSGLLRVGRMSDKLRTIKAYLRR